MEAENIKLKTLFAAVLSVVLLDILGANITRILAVSPLAALGCLRILNIALLIFIVIRYERNVLCIGLDPAGIRTGIRKGVLWALAVGLVTGCCALILYGFGINPLLFVKTTLPKSISGAVFYFLVGGIISPIAEEIFFRGIVFLFFRQWGFLPALILSTALFAALHPLSSGVPLPQIVGGLLFATAFEIEKNLLVPVLIHITGNLAIFTLSWLNA